MFGLAPDITGDNIFFILLPQPQFRRTSIPAPPLLPHLFPSIPSPNFLFTHSVPLSPQKTLDKISRNKLSFPNQSSTTGGTPVPPAQAGAFPPTAPHFPKQPSSRQFLPLSSNPCPPSFSANYSPFFNSSFLNPLDKISRIIYGVTILS